MQKLYTIIIQHNYIKEVRFLRKNKMFKIIAAVLTSVVMGSGTVFAGAIITSGDISMGIFDEGHLGYDDPVDALGPVGLSLTGVGDAIIPITPWFCLCEGWGVSGNGTDSGYAHDLFGVWNLSVVSFGSSASTATSVVRLISLPDLQVTQAYAPSADAPLSLFEDTVTITNSGSSSISDVRYTHVMDWDLPPTPPYEYVTIGGLSAANLLYSSDNGFAVPDPLTAGGFIDPATVNVNFEDIGAYDGGALFNFGFGSLAAGKSRTFSIFYGATTNESDAFSALTAVGAEVYSFGQSETTGAPGTFIFAAKGVGGTPVPEPSSLLLLSSGIISLAGIGAWRKRRHV